ncbi:MAG TPA: SurA N-terminal domain-containing protein [Fimbriimonadaceae bacterium]|nr:SurA N-terminal domain-containing protein [Fimbriimonadaceae bacterium]
MGVPFLRFPIYCGAGVALLLATGGCNRSGAVGGSSSAVATVGKDTITEKEFFAYLQRKPLVQYAQVARTQQNTVIPSDTIGFQAIKDLIVNDVTLQLAKEKGVYPTDKQITEEFESQRSQQPKLIDLGMLKGMSVEDLKHEFALELARYNLQVKGVTETTQDAQDYIKSHPSEFMDPPQCTAQVMIVKPGDRKLADSALTSGAPFATVAKQYTLQKDAEKYDFRYSPLNSNVNSFPPAIKALLEKTDEGRMTDWQPIDKQGQAYYKFYVMKKVAAKPTAQTPVLLESVRRVLAQQKGAKAGNNVNRDIAKKLRDMKDQIKIFIKQDQNPWNEFVTKLGDELTASAAPPAATPLAPGGTAGAAPTTPTPPPAAKK